MTHRHDDDEDEPHVHDEDDEELTEDDVLRIEQDYEKATTPEEKYDLALALGDIWLGTDAEASLAWYEAALDAAAGDPEALSGKAEALFELWRFREAAVACKEALGKGRDEARAHYVQAMLHERARKGDDARRHYELAHQRDPERFPLPARLSRKAFEQSVGDALKSIPEPVQQMMKDVTVVVEDFPDDELKDSYVSEGLAPTLLGLFEGTPPAERSHNALPALPPRITLYQKNLERVAHDRKTLVEEIANTVLHEVGHVVGMDEDDLEDAGYE